jgi:hypothetical protein
MPTYAELQRERKEKEAERIAQAQRNREQGREKARLAPPPMAIFGGKRKSRHLTKKGHKKSRRTRRRHH